MGDAVSSTARVLRPGPVAVSSAVRIYRPELDALRCFAFMCVFMHHGLSATGVAFKHAPPKLVHALTLILESCGFGLGLFFFLSSFLITSLLVLEKERTGTIALRKFYLRRILRIWPLYFAFIAAMYVLGLWWSPAAVESSRLVALSLLAGNWFSLVAGMGTPFLSHLWSISIEEQFYLIWPSLARLFVRHTMSFACAIICLASLIITGYLAATGSSSLHLWLNSFVQFVFFGAGALLALAIGMRDRPKSLIGAALSLLFGLAFWLIAEGVGGVNDRLSAVSPGHIVVAYLFIAIGCGLILYGFLLLPGRFFPKWLVYLGRISYGLYVFHGIALKLGRDVGGKANLHLPGIALLLSLLMTIAAATVSYEYFEKPFLKLKSRFELVKTRAA